MSQFFQIHSQNPQLRLIHKSIEILNKNSVIVYPTDSGYALGCKLGVKSAMQRMLEIRQIDLNHHLTLMCANLKEIGNYVNIDNLAFKLIKSLTPGAYTFILGANKRVPSISLHPKRKTIGIRIPDNNISLAVLEHLNEPLLSCSLILPFCDSVLTDMDVIREKLSKVVDLIIDGGFCGSEPTSVIDLSCPGQIQLIRKGKGDISILELE